MRGRCSRNARAKKRCDHAHCRPTLSHGVPRIFLTAPLSYAAVAFHLGQCEKRLRYVKLATSSLVECKRYAETQKVGVEIVRGLYGVVESQHATRGLIATTSYFTKGAKAFRDQNEYRLSLADFDMITKFLRDWKKR